MARKNFFGSNANIGRSVTIVNGKVVSSGSNVTIINGEVVSGNFDSNNLKLQKFDEKKVANISMVDTIKITSSCVDISVTTSEELDVLEAHLYGEAELEGDIKFELKKIKNILFILLEFNGCCFNSNLQLTVNLPFNFDESLFISTNSSDVKVEEKVKVSELALNTTSGDLTVNSDFHYGVFNTTSGDIDLHVNAKHDVTFKINATSGDISARFDNIKYFNVSTSSCSGEIKRRYKQSNYGFRAAGQIITTSGDILIS